MACSRAVGEAGPCRLALCRLALCSRATRATLGFRLSRAGVTPVALVLWRCRLGASARTAFSRADNASPARKRGRERERKRRGEECREEKAGPRITDAAGRGPTRQSGGRPVPRQQPSTGAAHGLSRLGRVTSPRLQLQRMPMKALVIAFRICPSRRCNVARRY